MQSQLRTPEGACASGRDAHVAGWGKSEVKRDSSDSVSRSSVSLGLYHLCKLLLEGEEDVCFGGEEIVTSF